MKRSSQREQSGPAIKRGPTAGQPSRDEDDDDMDQGKPDDEVSRCHHSWPVLLNATLDTNCLAHHSSRIPPPHLTPVPQRSYGFDWFPHVGSFWDLIQPNTTKTPGSGRAETSDDVLSSADQDELRISREVFEKVVLTAGNAHKETLSDFCRAFDETGVVKLLQERAAKVASGQQAENPTASAPLSAGHWAAFVIIAAFIWYFRPLMFVCKLLGVDGNLSRPTSVAGMTCVKWLLRFTPLAAALTTCASYFSLEDGHFTATVIYDLIHRKSLQIASVMQTYVGVCAYVEIFNSSMVQIAAKVKRSTSAEFLAGLWQDGMKRRAWKEFECLVLVYNILAFYTELLRVGGAVLVGKTQLRLVVTLVATGDQKGYYVPLADVANVRTTGQMPIYSIASALAKPVYDFLLTYMSNIADRFGCAACIQALDPKYFTIVLVAAGISSALNTIWTWRGIHFMVEVFTNGVIVGTFSEQRNKELEGVELNTLMPPKPQASRGERVGGHAQHDAIFDKLPTNVTDKFKAAKWVAGLSDLRMGENLEIEPIVFYAKSACGKLSGLWGSLETPHPSMIQAQEELDLDPTDLVKRDRLALVMVMNKRIHDAKVAGGKAGGLWGSDVCAHVLTAQVEHKLNPDDPVKRERLAFVVDMNRRISDAKRAGGQWGGDNNPALLTAEAEHKLNPDDPVKRESYRQVKARNDSARRKSTEIITQHNEAAKGAEAARRAAATAEQQAASAIFEELRKKKKEDAKKKKEAKRKG